ncbi:sulfatase-like hydrolase/transferase [Candidatus Woesearchaeota archaeon]|nr:sulfatase-like hydrolase/transferase [Candidatus Woesearchaeota archaeon]
MKVKDNIKLAAFAGLSVGILHGLVDITARLSVWSFEWFEFYQALLLSITAFTVGFVILGIITQIAVKLLKLKFNKGAYLSFYFSIAIIVLALFYVGVIVNRILLVEYSILSPIKLAVNILIITIMGLIFTLSLTKGRSLVNNFISFFGRKKIRTVVNELVFGVIIFIAVSLFLDIYLLNYMPIGKDNNQLMEQPNIVLVSLDAVRADHLNIYGYEANTSPNIDALAQNSIVFENAITVNVWSLLSHASMLTGKYVSNIDPEHTNQGINPGENSLSEILRNNGYNTAAFVSIGWIKAKYGFGQGFDIYNDRMDFFEYVQTFDRFSIREVIFAFFPPYKKFFDTDKERTAESTNKLAFKWLEKNKDKRFFMFLHYADAHSLYAPIEKFRKLFTNDSRTHEELQGEMEGAIKKVGYGQVDRNLVDSVIKLYDAEIYNADFELNRFINKLEELGIQDNTIVIIVADHGEEFYEHGLFKKHGSTLYQAAVNVPLIIYYPKEFEPKRVSETVGTIDIVPTILDILNIDIPEDLDGVSLLPLITNEGQYKREFIKSEIFEAPGTASKEQTAVYYGTWKLIEVEEESEALPSGLYNLRTDPNEQKNMYDVFPNKRKELQKFLYENQNGREDIK